MEAITAIVDVPEQQSSFGIKKIVDCKIGEDGQQMYKVKWEPTWEPAANLITCQHLIDEFWSFVNIAKANEEVAQQHRKRMKLQQSTHNMNIDQNFFIKKLGACILHRRVESKLVLEIGLMPLVVPNFNIQIC